MRDALTNFGAIAITAAATDATKAVKSENIIDMYKAGRMHTGPDALRFVFFPKANYTGTLTFQVLESDNVASNELVSPTVTNVFTVTNPTQYKAEVKPFPLEVKGKYMQISAYGSAATATNVEAWLEFGAGK